MSLSQISARPSIAHTLLQVSPTNSAKTQSDATIEIVKAANGIATNWGDAAKQASGVALTFTISQAERDEAQKADPMGIVVSGIGGGEVVERFESWDALEARIRTDRTMNDRQKTEWLKWAADLKERFLKVEEFRKSDFYLGIKSGALMAAAKAAMQKHLAEQAANIYIRETANIDPYESFSRNSVS